MEMGQAAVALALELPEGAEVLPGYGPGQLLVRCANGYGASLIHAPRGNGVEIAVIGFRPDGSGGWDFVRGTSVSPFDAIVPGVDSPTELLEHLGEIAGWDEYRQE